ncbi:MAG: biotin/lipoyl-binding protein [Thermodesulfobacteriota bacterium]|nr:biotin/lipoyl-binding protein [Thermodesulfobacteriota bacterium]
METILLLTYFSLCWVIFKIFKIPVNKWSLTTVVLGAVVMMGTLLMGMAYYHPASTSARSYFVTTQIVSNVRGKVTEVLVKPNSPLQGGEILFKIDPTPFQARVDDLTAQLEFARKRLKENRELVKVAGGSTFEVERYEKEVKSYKGKLAGARFNLDSCVVRAPGPGFITHLRVRPGQIAVPFPVAPLMTFVNTDSKIIIAGFTQQPMQNIKPGNHAEILFKGIPGRVFQARVVRTLDALAEGELSPERAMASLTTQLPEGQIPVIIEIEDDMSGFFVPLGSDAVVAVYSERWHHVTIIRKVLMRAESWRNFLHFH